MQLGACFTASLLFSAALEIRYDHAIEFLSTESQSLPVLLLKILLCLHHALYLLPKTWTQTIWWPSFGNLYFPLQAWNTPSLRFWGHRLLRIHIWIFQTLFLARKSCPTLCSTPSFRCSPHLVIGQCMVNRPGSHASILDNGKGHPSSRASYGIGWSFCCNCNNPLPVAVLESTP